MLLITTFTFLILISASLHIRAEYTGPRKHIYFFKPLTTSLIILLACYLGFAENAGFYAWMIIIGLVFSLSGDVFLMFEKYFALGLLSFLIAHLFYIEAFTSALPISDIIYWPSLLPFMLFGVLVLAYIFSGLRKLKIPVIFYLLVIVVMGWQATNHWLSFPSLLSLGAAAGAFIFMISDSLIAINRFKTPVKHARFWIMSTYYFAQWLIALSIIAASNQV
jgi:uncharacterized membrane protein YhhN